MLRLEMLATIDVRGNRPLITESKCCRACIDQRNAASAYAPRLRDEILQRIKKQKALRSLTYPPSNHSGLIEDDERSEFRGCVHNFELPMTNIGRYGEVNEDHRSSNTSWADLDVDPMSDPAINEAFEGFVRDRNYGWPEELRALIFHWASLHHWRLAYPTGIPAVDSAAHTATMQDFQTRHVHHPYELCSCKGRLVPHFYGCFCNDRSVDEWDPLRGIRGVFPDFQIPYRSDYEESEPEDEGDGDTANKGAEDDGMEDDNTENEGAHPTHELFHPFF
jgi:hypothetical protein